MSSEEREEFWGDVFVNEEGTIVEFDRDSNTGTVRSVEDGATYMIYDRSAKDGKFPEQRQAETVKSDIGKRLLSLQKQMSCFLA
jgi:hypothetical protein